MLKNNFQIATLSSRLGQAPGVDPISILIGAIPGLFNLFGKNPVTLDELNKLFPGNGYWTASLKNYLMQHIAWIDDAFPRHVDQKMRAFIQNVYSKSQCTSERAAGCFQVRTYPDVYECEACTSKFLQTLQQEQTTGGSQPFGQYPGGMFPGTISMNDIFLYGGIAIVAILLLKSKKRKK